jgi:hypothetical protein
MQSTERRDPLVAGTQIEVIGVAQKNLCAERLEIAMRDAFHRALRPDRHERRRFDVAVRGRQDSASRAAVGVGDAKAEGHVLSLSK